MQWTFEKAMEVVKAAISLSVAVIAGIGLNSYLNDRETVARSELYKNQIKVAEEVFRIARGLETASKPEELKALSEDFFAVHYGLGRIFLDSDMFEAMEGLNRYVQVCAAGIREDASFDCDHFTPLMHATALAQEIRCKTESVWGVEIGEIKDGWTPPGLDVTCDDL